MKVHLFSDVYWKRIPRDWTGVGDRFRNTADKKQTKEKTNLFNSP